jgi:hypothetical protein
MDLNLILSAQTLQLAPQLNKSEAINGLLVIKNIPAKTYLRVTPGQWLVLQQFREARTVPAVLDFAIRERICPPLGEFFELILKALEANILLEPGIVAGGCASPVGGASAGHPLQHRPDPFLRFSPGASHVDPRHRGWPGGVERGIDHWHVAGRLPGPWRRWRGLPSAVDLADTSAAFGNRYR